MKQLPAILTLLAALAGCAGQTPAERQALAQAAVSATATVIVQSAASPNCQAAIAALLSKTPAGAVGTACEMDAAGNVVRAGLTVATVVVKPAG